MIAGILCIILGLLIWKKQKISLLHDYHYKNVKEEDIPAYTRQMGIGLLLIGAGILAVGITYLLSPDAPGWIALPVGLLAGLVVMHRAQKKYNGSWFS